MLARIRRPLKFVAERIDGADRRLGPRTRAVGPGPVSQPGAFMSWDTFLARSSRQRLGPSRHFADDLRSPMGAIVRDLERDPGTLDSDNFSLVH